MPEENAYSYLKHIFCNSTNKGQGSINSNKTLFVYTFPGVGGLDYEGGGLY